MVEVDPFLIQDLYTGGLFIVGFLVVGIFLFKKKDWKPKKGKEKDDSV